VVAELRKYLPGWKEYFQLAETPRVFADHDKRIRHRPWALQLKQWKRGSNIYAEMRRFGLSAAIPQAAAVRERWWSRAAQLVHARLIARYYDRMGVPRLAD
jgi:RNA-directed DNA polymerase